MDQRPEPAPAQAGVERMNRTIKKTTVKRCHYDSHDQLRQHFGDFVAAYNFARRLKTLRACLRMGSTVRGMIQAWDVDAREPWPDG